MPRLLLVDDNPSIHKIAETLLATTPITLACASSASAALDLISQGEHFDVALVDISMAGMDGWALVERMRETPATAGIPIAMMAGVLDTVDPERIKNAPIQGFLKKPVELRELGDRVNALLSTPVPPPAPKVVVPEPVPVDPVPIPTPIPASNPGPSPSPFATMPAVPIPQLPEFRRPSEEPAEPSVPVLSADDVLELTEEDLYPESQPEEEGLDLEELDIEGLRGLEPAAIPVVALPAMEDVAPEPVGEEVSFEALDAISTYDHLPEVSLAPEPMAEDAADALPDLGGSDEELLTISTLTSLPEMDELAPLAVETQPVGAFAEPLEAEAPFVPPLPPLEESLDWSDDSDSLLETVEMEPPATDSQAVEPPSLLPPEDGAFSVMGAGSQGGATEEELDLFDVSIPGVPLVEEPAAAVAMTDLSGSGQDETLDLDSGEAAEVEVSEPVPEPVPEPVETVAAVPAADEAPKAAAPEGTQALMEALLADPRFMDSLAKAVVARLGDQTLREIAWEVMPELAERLPRN